MPGGFADIATAYRDARPVYPDALFTALARLAPDTRRALDVGAASGQATPGLQRVFSHVVAVDLDTRLLVAGIEAPDRAPPASNHAVDHVVAPEKRLPFRAASFELIVAAQAAHWFDLARIDADPPLDAQLRRLYAATPAPFWPPERRRVERHYRDAPFPCVEIAAASTPSFAAIEALGHTPVNASSRTPTARTRANASAMSMSALWTCDQLLRYVDTASAVRRARAQHDKRVERALDHLANLAGQRGTIAVRWPLFGRVATHATKSGKPAGTVPRAGADSSTTEPGARRAPSLCAPPGHKPTPSLVRSRPLSIGSDLHG